MSPSRWPRSPSHGKCSKRFCGSSRNCGRCHHQRQHETFDSHAFKSNRRNECVRMPRKTARSGSQTPLGRSGMSGTIHPLAAGFQPVQKTPTIHVSSGFIWGIPVMKTKGHGRGARRVEGTGITDLRPLADSLDTYARHIHSTAEIIRVQLEARSIEEKSAEQSTEAKAAENTAPCSPHAEFCSIAHNLSGIHSIARASAAFRAPETRWQIASGLIVSTARRALRLPGFYPTRASDGKLLLAPKVIAAVIWIVGIPLLIFSFGQIKPFGSAAHLEIQNQKGLTIGQWSTPEPYSAPPAEQTEPTPGPTPATSGRAELTPAPPPPRRINWRRNR